MPKSAKDDPFQGGYFMVVLKGKDGGDTEAFFTGCSGISIEVAEVKFKENNGKKNIEKKIYGEKATYSEIVLKRGFSANRVLQDWFDEVVKAKAKAIYTEASIVVYDRLGEEKARFNLEGCWPSGIKVSDLSAGSDEAMIEELTIQTDLLVWA